MTKTATPREAGPELTVGYFGPIVKYDKLGDGTLMVYGQCTDAELDSDGQVSDPTWLAKAVPAWMEWGNVREQHQSIAAGVGKELTAGDQPGQWFLKSHIVDPGTCKKVETGVLKGYSYSAVNGRIQKDASAPNGRIMAGDIIEFSLVDRPSLPKCTIAIVKSAGAGQAFEPVEAPQVQPGEPVILDDPNLTGPTPPEVIEKTVSWYRDALRTVEDAYAGQYAPVNAWAAIVRKAAGEKAPEADDIATAYGAIDTVLDLIIAEATQAKGGRIKELRDIEVLLSAARSLCHFIECERDEESGGDDEYGHGHDYGNEPIRSMAYAKAWDGEDGDRVIVKSVTAEQRREAKAEGDTMPDGSYPITNQTQLDSAVHLAGHSKTYSLAQVKAHIRRQARKHGLTLPPSMSGRTAKAAGSTLVDDPLADAILNDQNTMIQKAVASAQAEWVAAHEAELIALRADLQKAQGVPTTGGPVAFKHVLTQPAAPTVSQQAVITKAAEARRFRDLADKPGLAPDVAHAYRERARQLEGGAST